METVHVIHKDGAQEDLKAREWEQTGRLFLACTQLYRSNPTDIDYIQNRLGQGLAKELNKAFPEFDGGITVSIKPQTEMVK